MKNIKWGNRKARQVRLKKKGSPNPGWKRQNIPENANEFIFCGSSIAVHGACPWVWFQYAVRLHWRIPVSPVGGCQLEIASGSGWGVHEFPCASINPVVLGDTASVVSSIPTSSYGLSASSSAPLPQPWAEGLPSSFLCAQSETPVHGIVLSTFGMGLPTSTNLS